MMITNANEAAQWIRAWDGAPRKGIARETIRGLRMAAGICRNQGNVNAARDYDAAADLIARAAGIVCPECNVEVIGDTCPKCDVDFTEPCGTCKRVGYHAEGCAEIGGAPVETAAHTIAATFKKDGAGAAAALFNRTVADLKLSNVEARILRTKVQNLIPA